MNTHGQIVQATASRSAGERVNLLGLTRAGLEAYFHEMGERPFRAVQLLKWIHQQRVTEFSAMTNISKELRVRLEREAAVQLPEIVTNQKSTDGTIKWLIRMASDNCIEMVFIPDEPRGTLCISSQIGCALNCTFCSTARQGFNRNLSSAEIIAQVWLARNLLESVTSERRTITNIVLMGMGEPLLNFDNVVDALDLMLEDNAHCFARRRVTLSTAGVVPKIDALKQRCPVSLAVSLHAPNDRLRDQLVPLNKHYPIRDLLAACRRYVQDDPREKVTFEYVLLAGVNDSPAHARELASLLADVPAKVNLIPFNPFPMSGYERSSNAVIDDFREVLMTKKILTITRKTRGDDIDAACGQLAGEVQPRSRRMQLRRSGRLAPPDTATVTVLPDRLQS
ncbi:MAG: 23S rRNA (adenine(2503)-C(2))-methyltransferase RlmN [Lysobacterales bacterium]|nr:MAG: 23S rRNA (adenine(2503)-C(2))-methyltransferase RlmN [Xanthomonadales bacterium]